MSIRRNSRAIEKDEIPNSTLHERREGYLARATSVSSGFGGRMETQTAVTGPRAIKDAPRSDATVITALRSRP